MQHTIHQRKQIYFRFERILSLINCVHINILTLNMEEKLFSVSGNFNIIQSFLCDTSSYTPATYLIIFHPQVE